MLKLSDKLRRDEIEVLVVGAGPTGLILCHELLRRGIHCRLIEKRPSPSGSTRAFTLHARTMEMFDHMGIASRIDELREVCPGNRFHFRELPDSCQSPVLDFRRLPGTRYNYYGKVNQCDLDQALRESLAGKYSFHPEYGTEYLGSEAQGDRVSVRIRREGGDDEMISVPWLVGADGSGSLVRESLGVAFVQNAGNTMTMSMVDVHLDGFNGDPAWVNYYVSAKGFMLVTGLPGDKFRLYLAGEMEKLLKEGTPQEAFQRGLDFFNTGARIVAMDWSSSWIIRKIVGDTYFRGRTILCGDATHVHSPAGGQGMNACMQDAFNLGWKLAALIRGEAHEAILDTYPTERRPIAEQVTQGADRMHQILFNAAIPVSERFELTQDPNWHDEAILRISALSHNYRGVDGIAADLVLTGSDVRPGDRAPDCVLSETAPKRRLYDVLRHTEFTLMLLLDDSESAHRDAAELGAAIAKRYRKRIKTVAVSPVAVEGFDYDQTVIDPTGMLHRAYGGPQASQVIVVRPDLYVGFRGLLSSRASLGMYLEKWLRDARDTANLAAV
ncbi:MAG: FAD-dependent monooxygenase [Panacagrimonas sp.]